MTLKPLATALDAREFKAIFVLRVIVAGRRLRRGRGLATSIQLDIVLQVHHDHERSLMNSPHILSPSPPKVGRQQAVAARRLLDLDDDTPSTGLSHPTRRFRPGAPLGTGDGRIDCHRHGDACGAMASHHSGKPNFNMATKPP